MRIYVTGEENRLSEFRERIGKAAEVTYAVYRNEEGDENLTAFDAIFDLNLDDNPEGLERYAMLEGKPVIVSAVKTQLAEMAYYLGNNLRCTLAGMNALPIFIGKEKAEVSLYRKEDEAAIKNIFAELSWPCQIVDDRVGMVSPRIVFMIINEAYCTLQEGTASAEDIDQSMKLGTNYPLGPFEWCRKVGVVDVYETLEALWQDTHDERYKVCPLLKREYLKGVQGSGVRDQ